jgi:hypothetical protein
VPQPLALCAEIVLGLRRQSIRVLDERSQLGQPRLGCGCSPCQLFVAPPRGAKLAPGAPSVGAAPLLVLARERVEQVELVRGSGQAPLLELARHRDQSLGRGGNVLPRGAAAPGIRARAPIGEDAACEHETVFVLGPELGQRGQPLVVEEPLRRLELRLDVRVVAVRADERSVAAGAQQQADRLGQDRLPGAGLAGDRVQAGRERQLRLANQDEVLDAKAPEHGLDATSARRARRPAESDSARWPLSCSRARTPGWVGVRDGTGPARTRV